MIEKISKNGLYYRLNDFHENQSTLVFVHGISGSSSAWLSYEKFFNDKYNTLSLDLRGHGKSIKYKNCNDYSLEKMADDIKKLLEELKLNKFTLISHSFAVLVVFEFIKKYGEMLNSLILLSPNFSVGERPLEKIAKPFIKFLAFAVKALPFSQKPGRHIDYEKYKNSGDWNVRRMMADIGNTGLRTYIFGSLQTYGKNYAELLEKIAVPTLIIHGEKDTIFPVENSKIIADKIKNSKLVILPNTDHIIVLNNSPEVSVEIKKFLESKK